MDEKNRSEQQAIVDRLKTTWTAFGGLSKEEQEFLLSNNSHVGRVDSKGRTVSGYCEGYLGSTYRLLADFQLPPEPEKEQFAFNTKSKVIYSRPVSLREHDTRAGWIEITAEQKAYLETKPKAEAGFEWVLKVPVIKDQIWCLSCLKEETCVISYYATFAINGIRWVKVPVKAQQHTFDTIIERLEQFIKELKEQK